MVKRRSLICFPPLPLSNEPAQSAPPYRFTRTHNQEALNTEELSIRQMQVMKNTELADQVIVTWDKEADKSSGVRI